MNARVFLLILVTAAFLAAWDGDQAAMQAALARRSQFNAQRIAAAAQVDDTPMQTVSVSNTQIKTDATPAVPVAATIATNGQIISADDVPLPPGITAGTFHAVNQSGQAITLEVTESSDAPNRDFYMADAKNGDRWYLIRVK